MALTPVRHAVIMAELRSIHTYLISLAREINEAAPLTNKREATYLVTISAADRVAHLCQLLAEAQEKLRSGAAIRRRL